MLKWGVFTSLLVIYSSVEAAPDPCMLIRFFDTDPQVLEYRFAYICRCKQKVRFYTECGNLYTVSHWQEYKNLAGCWGVTFYLEDNHYPIHADVLQYFSSCSALSQPATATE